MMAFWVKKCSGEVQLVIALILASLLLPTSATAQTVSLASSTDEFEQINSNEVHPGRGSVNQPKAHASQKKLASIGNFCEHDSDCGNYSICSIVVLEDEWMPNICQCDVDEMLRVNQSCYMKPGYQCYFPGRNKHGYRHVQCYPGSECILGVNKSAVHNGYCMCTQPSLELRYREVRIEFEMQHCGASSIEKVNYLSFIVFKLTVLGFKALIIS